MSASSALYEPLFPHCEDLPFIRYLIAEQSSTTGIGTAVRPCDILTLRFPPSTPTERRTMCLQALDFLVASNTTDNKPSPYICKIAGPMKEEFGIAGGELGIYRAYIVWGSSEEEEAYKACRGGRHLWSQLEEVGDRNWRQDLGFYDALEEVWATEGVEVERGWINTIGHGEYMSRHARAISNAWARVSSLGGRHVSS